MLVINSHTSTTAAHGTFDPTHRHAPPPTPASLPTPVRNELPANHKFPTVQQRSTPQDHWFPVTPPFRQWNLFEDMTQRTLRRWVMQLWNTTAGGQGECVQWWSWSYCVLGVKTSLGLVSFGKFYFFFFLFFFPSFTLPDLERWQGTLDISLRKQHAVQPQWEASHPFHWSSRTPPNTKHHTRKEHAFNLW